MNKFPLPNLENWVTDFFLHMGLLEKDAASVAANLVLAQARGVFSHGLIMLPNYAERIKKGGIKSNYQIKTFHESETTAWLDGDGGPGQTVLHEALNLGIKKAKKNSISHICVSNNNHVGMLADYGIKSVEHNLIGIIMTNAGPSMTPYQGLSRILGNNAFCFAAPTKDAPFMLDLATGVVACGKVRVAELHGQPIPKGWMKNISHLDTQNPSDLNSGGYIVPFGEYKGYGIAILVDILSAMLGEGIGSMSVLKQRLNKDKPIKASQSLILIDPNSFSGLSFFQDNITKYLNFLRESTPRVKDNPVLIPGDKENHNLLSSQMNGVPISYPLLKLINQTANKFSYSKLFKPF